CPAGRIHAGAGTDKLVTLINCFVSPDIQDAMVTEDVDIYRTVSDTITISVSPPNSAGIMDALQVAAVTQQMGGGIGMDYSDLSPNGALVRKRLAPASGPLEFMDMWNSMCKTI